MTKVKRFDIDLSEVSGYVDGEHDEVIRRELSRYRVLSDKFLYTVLDGDRADELERTGTYGKPGGEVQRQKDSIFAFRESELVWDALSVHCIKTHIGQYLNPALAVWKRNHFTVSFFSSGEEYIFKNPERKPEALTAIAQLVLE